MSIRIIESNSDTDSYAVLYCSTSMWAFGPVFEDAEQAEEFLKWLIVDPRGLEDRELERKYWEFRETREKEEEEDEPPKADAYGDYLGKFSTWLDGFEASMRAPKVPK